jgi:diguanylate cyclase (GGDEF)-like protein
MFDRLLTYDELTGALKRKFLNETYRTYRRTSLDKGQPYTVALLDVDGLRTINESYGPLAGDRVLKAVVDLLKQTIEAPFTILRYNGGSFLLFIENRQELHAKRDLEAAVQSFNELSFEAGADEFRSSFSAGVAEADDASEPVEHWIELAGKALRAAKAGRLGVAAARSSQSADEKRTYRMAIIDDDAIMRTMLQEHAQKCFPGNIHLDIRVFPDGEAFLTDDWTHSEDTYFVILDRMMPQMDGLGVLQRLRQLKQSDRYTVLILTAKSAEADVIKALQLGADDYIAKPFSVRELETRIRRLAKRINS